MLRRLLLPACLILAAGCAGARPEPLVDASAGWTETGEASWYGPGFHGKRTASGEVYDMEALTAAHRRLPFGTRVLVENRDNGRRVEVRINDRGPFAGGRILDVSRAAARALGMLGPGTARVRIRVLDPSPLLDCAEVQAGAFGVEANANRLAARYRREGEAVRVRRGADGLWRVVLGPYDDLRRAERMRDRTGGLLAACGEAGS